MTVSKNGAYVSWRYGQNCGCIVRGIMTGDTHGWKSKGDVGNDGECTIKLLIEVHQPQCVEGFNN
jgi:hypothetical protein